LRGFTLVEVLVALVIVALGMGAALAALSSAADNTARLRDRGFAQWIGFNQISTTRLALQMPGEGTTSGDIKDYANARWHWQQEIQQLDTPGIYRITVKVRHADGASDSSASWLADVTGFRGDAVSGANGQEPNWNGPPVNNRPTPTPTPTPGTTATPNPANPGVPDGGRGGLPPGSGAAPPGTSGPPAGS
jgi:general secretion pathway protein I